MEIILEEAGRAASQVVEAAVAGHAAAVSATIQHAEKLRKAMDIKDQVAFICGFFNVVVLEFPLNLVIRIMPQKRS